MRTIQYLRAAMTHEQQIKIYLQKALDAEDRAAIMTDPVLKADWECVAKAYYRLADKLAKCPFNLGIGAV